ncbi:WxL domain-containing protein [Latilactobacillus sakei]|uniref:WxL domain-containing protein n=1 Tax=Latilactobacillus sakei TaxID=1599 RepID=A0AAF0K9T6_LATSK|nr:WxL domain-containing protein [Latilactobacillus sakei]WGI18845.1 WxL domain-containing protein [Latilactobacillus sakei]SON71881.1 conserved exported protein of unknown function [Latilactobacillus sakei]
MKFTGLISTTLLSATTLASLLAPAATFAATPNNDADANGGTALPQTDQTTAGISFGDNKPNPNTGYLRLQKVPSILDFGNHVEFNQAYPNFTADGKNTGNASNNRFTSYKEADTNLTPVLKNTEAKNLGNMQGMTWVSVVDKQATRTNADAGKKVTAKAGSWTLSVKANGALTRIDTDGNQMDGSIPDANIIFNKTASAQTQDIYNLTGEAQDKDWTSDDSATAVSTDSSKISVPLATTTGNGAVVATAKDGEGSGANVFGWKPSDVTLALPASATVTSPAKYQAQLTWTLSSDAANA